MPVSEPLHYAATTGCLTIYLGRVPVMIARKDYQITQLAKDALCGRLSIPAAGGPIEVYDHAWLLRFASVAAGVAADMASIRDGSDSLA
jgi:hypothetical protein